MPSLELFLDGVRDRSGQDLVVNGLLGFLGVGDPVRIEVEQVVEKVPHKKLRDVRISVTAHIIRRLLTYLNRRNI